jgi:hypothetical protein
MNKVVSRQPPPTSLPPLTMPVTPHIIACGQTLWIQCEILCKLGVIQLDSTKDVVQRQAVVCEMKNCALCNRQ